MRKISLRDLLHIFILCDNISTKCNVRLTYVSEGHQFKNVLYVYIMHVSFNKVYFSLFYNNIDAIQMLVSLMI